MLTKLVIDQNRQLFAFHVTLLQYIYTNIENINKLNIYFICLVSKLNIFKFEFVEFELMLRYRILSDTELVFKINQNHILWKLFVWQIYMVALKVGAPLIISPNAYDI